MDPYLYQYGIGGLLLAVGLVYAGRQGYLAGAQGRRNLAVMLGGFAALAALQGWLQYAPMPTAEPLSYDGPPLDRGRVLGTPLDYGIMVGYFLVMLFVGTFFGRGQGGTKDFFFGGQRFSWWLIAFSLVATTIGSYSFVKYSRIAYNYGLASTQTYLNDWFWLPLLLFGWLPILYFGRLTSIPEYFEHRFSPLARRVVTAMLLVYLVGYVGINLFTMGKALHALVPDLGVVALLEGTGLVGAGSLDPGRTDVLVAAAVVAVISAIYVTFGGQTSVIMTDLFQGMMLLATGLLVLILGADRLGGFDLLWTHLPRSHRMAFPAFNADPSYPAVGIFWQDAMANSAMFYFLNQGILMRFMAARSVQEGRRAAVAVLAVLMPVAAVVVASGGWVGRAFVHAGLLPADVGGDEVFFVVAEMLARPGIFGLIMAALTAALMSTVDSLITAVAAIVVNDVYVPLRPGSTDGERLRAARIASVAVTLLGVALVPVFQQFGSIYAAHGAFTAAITPPMVVALLLGVFWWRMTPAAAVSTMLGGGALIFASVLQPDLIAPFAHGVPPAPLGEGLFGGASRYTFMRAFFGIVVSVAIGVGVSLLTRPREVAAIRGWVWGTIPDAIRRYKGRDGSEACSAPLRSRCEVGEGLGERADIVELRLSCGLARRLEAGPGDRIYVQHRYRWLGGLRSGHGVVVAVEDGEELRLAAPGPFVEEVGRDVWVQRMY